MENYPETDSAIPPRIGWKEFTTTLAAYSPDFNYVAYYTGSNAIMLYDIRQKEVLLTLYPEWDFVPLWGYGPPRWASNSKNFFIDMNTNLNLFAKGIWSEEIFRVSITEEQERLTYLADQYPEVAIESLMVSPDDKKIAFWISTDTSNPNLTLAILEIATKRTKILDGITFNVADTFMPPSPIWAPDSNQLMVNIRDEATRFTTILIDLEENSATELAWDTKPIGWLYDQ